MIDDRCTLGVGCDESGVCYADAHGEPEMCGSPLPVTQSDVDCRNAIYLEMTGLKVSDETLYQADWMDKYISGHRIASQSELVAENRRLREAIANMANNINIVGSNYDIALMALNALIVDVKNEARNALIKAGYSS